MKNQFLIVLYSIYKLKVKGTIELVNVENICCPIFTVPIDEITMYASEPTNMLENE